MCILGGMGNCLCVYVCDHGACATVHITGSVRMRVWSVSTSPYSLLVIQLKPSWITRPGLPQCRRAKQQDCSVKEIFLPDTIHWT